MVIYATVSCVLRVRFSLFSVFLRHILYLNKGYLIVALNVTVGALYFYMAQKRKILYKMRLTHTLSIELVLNGNIYRISAYLDAYIW